MLAKEINALAQKDRELFNCQCNQDKPRTKFSKCIFGARKIMAKEHTGVLLLMAAVLQLLMGRNLLGKRKKYFGEENQLKDWTVLVDTLLEWEEWLKSNHMEKKHVKVAQQKH